MDNTPDTWHTAQQEILLLCSHLPLPWPQGQTALLDLDHFIFQENFVQSFRCSACLKPEQLSWVERRSSCLSSEVGPKGKKKRRAELFGYLCSAFVAQPTKAQQRKHKWCKMEFQKVTKTPAVHSCMCSLETNTQHKEKSASLTANLLLLWWKNTHRGQGPPANHTAGRQFIKYQRGKKYNKGLVRKDSSGEGKSHTDTTEGQFPSPLQQGNSWLPDHPLFLCPRGTTRAKLLLPCSVANSACSTLHVGKSTGFGTMLLGTSDTTLMSTTNPK